MAMTAQQVRPASVTKEKSYLATKRNLAIAISSIAYIRHLFPRDAFREQKIDSMKIWILKRNSQARTIVEWMNGVYDALEKEYLKKLILIITYKSSDTGKDILETYTFGFSYAGREVLTDMKLASSGHPTRSAPITSEDTKKSAQKFISNLYLLVSTFEDIGPSFKMSMRLSYYEEDMPIGYQPPGFESGDLEGIDTASDVEVFNVGKTEQGYHTTSLIIKRMSLLSALRTGFVPNEDSLTVQLPADSQGNEDSMVHQTHEQQQSGPPSPPQGTQIIVRCPCGSGENEGTMISCMSCGFWQHAICFCVCAENAPDVHVCNICADPSKPNLYPTDATLCNLDDKRLREVCNWRRALEACFSTNSITVNSMSLRLSCSKVIAKKILNQMVAGRIANPNKDRKCIKDINRTNLERAYYRDIQKPSADMHEQVAEARKHLQSANDGKHIQSNSGDDTTPVKLLESERVSKSVKRKLGVDSQEDFRACPDLQKKVKCKKR